MLPFPKLSSFPLLLLAAVLPASLVRGETLTLPEAVQRALLKNYTLKAAALGPDIGKAEVTAAWGVFDPAFELSYTYIEDGSNVSSDLFNPNRPATALTQIEEYRGGLVGYALNVVAG